MKNATVMNDVQGIQNVLEKYIEKRKAEKVAVEIFAVMQGKTTGNCKTKATEFETIKIPGSDSYIYAELMKHEPANDNEEGFIKDLKKAVITSVNEFEVFVNDPSIDGEGKLQFVPGYEPAVGFSYNELEELAKENGVRLGTKDEYILFLGWLITALINEGWSEENAWYAVCCNSTLLGNYRNSVDAKDGFESTGSRRVAGKCDLVNAYKVLAKGDASRFWLAGGNCHDNGDDHPLALFYYILSCDHFVNRSVGWFVI